MRRAIIAVTAILLVTSITSLPSSGQNSRTWEKFPRVVATVRLFRQTGPISPTKIFVPKKFGVYRLSAIGVVTLANGQNANWNTIFQWTDGGGKESTQCLTLPTEKTGSSSCSSFALRDLKANSLTYSVTQSGDTSGSRYNLFIVVEQIM